MSSSRQGHTVFDPVHTAAADNEQAAPSATKEALEAWGGLKALRPMVVAAVNDWQETVCDFRRGGSIYETPFLNYGNKMPEHLHLQPGLNTEEDRIHLTLPALVMRVTLAENQAGHLQWAIAVRNFNPPGAIKEIAGPALLRSQQPPSNDVPCVFIHKASRRTILAKGLPVKTRSESGRNVHIYMKQHDIDGYQVSGVTEHSTSIPPRRVDFDFTLTIPHAKSDAPPPLHLRVTFDLDYDQPGHAGAVMAHEVVARSLGERAPRVLRRW